MIPGACTVPRKAWLPPFTHALNVAASAASRRPLWDAVASTARMGAVPLGGSEAGAPDGDTQPIAPRNDDALHPAAGNVPP
jgi:hypothetical protein